MWRAWGAFHLGEKATLPQVCALDIKTLGFAGPIRLQDDFAFNLREGLQLI